MRIAIVQSMGGKTTVCGPDDFQDHFSNAMDAAISWHIEGGNLPAGFYWAEIELPPCPEIPIVPADLETHEISDETRKDLYL